jgi:uncharacterized membrane protein YkvA (DUF1232 family)
LPCCSLGATRTHEHSVRSFPTASSSSVVCSQTLVSGWRKAAIIALIAYLAMPIDLVPDFIPVAGQLDDAIIVALVLRIVLRSGGPELLEEHWPGPQRSLEVVMRLAYGTEGGAG